MNSYVTGAMIKRLREERKLTQSQFGDKIGVSDKTVSKWETGRGLPDISLIEPLADALGVSVFELFSGNDIINKNKNFNMKNALFYVCPVCGNVFTSCGEAVISCCGITLPPLSAEEPDTEHTVNVEVCEDEYYISLDHEMSKSHYISFLAAVTHNGIMLTKLYPEGEASARFKINGVYAVYAFCNKHGLYRLLRRNF